MLNFFIFCLTVELRAIEPKIILKLTHQMVIYCIV